MRLINRASIPMDQPFVLESLDQLLDPELEGEYASLEALRAKLNPKESTPNLIRAPERYNQEQAYIIGQDRIYLALQSKGKKEEIEKPFFAVGEMKLK